MKKRLLLVLVLISIATAAQASDFETPAWRIVLPGTWLETVADHGVTYLNAAQTEMVTASTYAFTHAPLDESQRRQLLLKSVALRRSAESDWSTGGLLLSTVRQERSGAFLTMRYSGEDAAAKRRFRTLVATSREGLQSFHYEAVGLDAEAFRRSADAIFHGLELREPSRRLEAYSCARLTTQCLHPALSPRLQAVLPGLGIPRTAVVAQPRR
jgi:hypothetical protein